MLGLWRLMQIQHMLYTKADQTKNVKMCKLSSGNFLATHLLVHYLTKIVKKFLTEPEFIQERFMLWQCWTNTTRLQTFEKKTRQGSQQNCCSQHLPLSLCLERNWCEMLCLHFINLWLDLLGERSFLFLLPVPVLWEPAVSPEPSGWSVWLRLYHHMDVSCSELPSACGDPQATEPS